MADKGFMSKEHLDDYVASRMLEAMKEGIMRHSNVFRKDIYSKELQEFLISVYESGFADGFAATTKIVDDIQKVNGGIIKDGE